MGYRARLGVAEKRFKRRFKGCTYEQADMLSGENCAPYRPYFHTELFELGKYFNKPEFLTPFYDFDVYRDGESEFMILSKEGLKAIIEMYHNNIAQMYEEAWETKDKACEHIKNKVRTWSRHSYARHPLVPYFLDQEHTDGEIANSWLYEYSIFNLIYIYRTFNWERDYLIYSAW